MSEVRKTGGVEFMAELRLDSVRVLVGMVVPGEGAKERLMRMRGTSSS